MAQSVSGSEYETANATQVTQVAQGDGSHHRHLRSPSPVPNGVKLPALVSKQMKVSPRHSASLGARMPQQADGIAGQLAGTTEDTQTMATGQQRATVAYSMSGDHFLMPHRSQLPPGQDLEPSSLDAWPRQDAAMASFLHLGSPVRHHPLTGQRYQVAPSDAQLVKGSRPQAHLVALLTKRIDSELERSGLTRDSMDQDKLLVKLQIYRDAFSVLISRFQSYRPLLADVMAVYDETVQQQDYIIRSLQPLEKAMQAVQRDCERKLLRYQEEEKTTIDLLKKRNQELLDLIEEMRARDQGWMAKVNKLSTELSLAYKQYRDEADQRTLLVTELNDMRFRQQDMEKAKGKEEKIDPVLMSMMVGRLKKDLQTSQDKLVETIADYGDVVPRKEFDKLSKTAKKLEKDLKVLRDGHTKLAKEHKALQKAHEDMTKQRNTLGSEFQELHRSSTPRPDWDPYREHLQQPEEEGAGEWKDIRDCRTSRQMSDAVLAKLNGQPLPEVVDGKYGPQVFIAKGTGTTVLRHLRGDGVVRNRHIRHKELLVLIQELWTGFRLQAEKAQQSRKKRLAMSDHFWNFLEHRYAVPPLCTEWAYSVDDACRRYSTDDAHVGLFHAALNKQMSEDVYDAQLKAIRGLESKLLVEAAEAAADAATGAGGPAQDDTEEKVPSQISVTDKTIILKITGLSDCLQKVYPVKGTTSIDALCDCAVDEASAKPPSPQAKLAGEDQEQEQDEKETDGDAEKPGESGEVEAEEDEEPFIDVKKLFAEDETGFTSEFVHLLRDQERRERVEYLLDISTALTTEAGESEISPDKLRAAVQSTDPEKPAADVDQIVSLAFAMPVQSIPGGKTCPLETILERLQTKALQRSSARPE